jgi:hypothetical protein
MEEGRKVRVGMCKGRDGFGWDGGSVGAAIRSAKIMDVFH